MSLLCLLVRFSVSVTAVLSALKVLVHLAFLSAFLSPYVAACLALVVANFADS